MARQGFKVPCLIDGILQVELSNVQFTCDGGKIEIPTMNGDFAVLKGSGSFELTGTWSWFTTGPEINIFEWCSDATTHDVQIPIGNGKSLISTGQFMTSGGSQSVNQAGELTATFKGSFSKPR
jgi:hypothetical protein